MNYYTKTNEIENKIQSLLAEMTLEEKVGQLHQMGPTTSSTLAGYEVDVEELLTEFLEGRMSEKEFQEKIGRQEESLNEADVKSGRLGNFIGLYVPEKIAIVQKLAMEQSRLGIPLLIGADIIRGYRTIFPTPLAQSCSWNMELVTAAADVAAKEACAGGIHWVFGPMLDIARDSRWGRIVEGPGEDPYLAAKIARASVLGFQGEACDENGKLLPGKIAACMKHFAAYGAASGGQDYNTVDMSLPMLYNTYLPPFKAAVSAGVASTMTAFHDLNGVPCTMDQWLVTDVLRGEMGFDGMVVSDAEAVKQCTVHGTAEDLKDAALQAMLAGNDMDMSSRCNDMYLADLVREGAVSEERLDEAVGNVLRMKLKAGLWDSSPDYDKATAEKLYLCPEHRSLSRRFAGESMVLLENKDHILPFSKTVKKLAVIGALADDAENFLGPWAFAGGRADETVTILQGIREALAEAHGEHATDEVVQLSAGDAADRAADVDMRLSAGDAADCAGDETSRVVYAYGCDIRPLGVDEAAVSAEDRAREDAQIEAAVKAAMACDAVVIVAGEALFMSGEAASRARLTLTGRQEELIRRVCAAGKPTAVLLVNGRALEVGWLKDLPCAVLEVWHPGTEGGHAVADVLIGDVNPSGHLTITFPNTAGQEPMYYNHPNTGKPGGKFKFTSKYQDVPVAPAWPFGHGLSYTSFEYSDLLLSADTISVDGAVDISVTVRNTGGCGGADVVQLYVHDVCASHARPVRELKGFKKIWIPAGESRVCHFRLEARDLGFYHRDMSWAVEPGKFMLWVGEDSTGGLETEFNVTK